MDARACSAWGALSRTSWGNLLTQIAGKLNNRRKLKKGLFFILFRCIIIFISVGGVCNPDWQRAPKTIHPKL